MMISHLVLIERPKSSFCGCIGDVLGPYHSGQEIYTNAVSIFDTGN